MNNYKTAEIIGELFECLRNDKNYELSEEDNEAMYTAVRMLNSVCPYWNPNGIKTDKGYEMCMRYSVMTSDNCVNALKALYDQCEMSQQLNGCHPQECRTCHIPVAVECIKERIKP